MKNKIYTLKQLSKIIERDKKGKKNIILCHGVFDLLHIGHIKHLKKAKTYAEKLVVTITSDKFVNKGLGRPVFNQFLRSQAIAAIQDVDYVAINDNLTAISPNYKKFSISYSHAEYPVFLNSTKEKSANLYLL